MTDAALDLLAQEKRWPPTQKSNERSRFLTLLHERHSVGLDILNDRNKQGVHHAW
ncbi:hypothetical protein D3C77_754920 [compost metagenome]